MRLSIYQKQLVRKYEKMPIKKLVSIYDLAMQKIVSHYSELTGQELTKVQTKMHILLDIIEQKRSRFEFED